ncbi:MAG TPA: hypothetical protein VM581_05285 [Magnetospirillaceae bacterium]|nr:hypothetical protein [Magnetospirillaceae bacterium]
MDPAHTPDHHKPHHETPPPFTPIPSVAVSAPAHTVSGSSWLHRTSSAFVAEYCMFIIALGIALASLSWLIYMFFFMIIAAMNGANFGGSPLKLIVLWLFIASLVSLPTAYVLWSRTRGELLANEHFKGVLPGGARGFRTFWIVLTVLGMIGMLIFSLYTPLATLVSASEGFGQSLLAVTLPGVINLGFSAAGIYVMTRPAAQPGPSKMVLWLIIGLSTLLFIVNFAWVASQPDNSYRTTPYYDSYYDSY